ncbi:MAG: hypothetical protein LBP76_06950 [Treponema sp.]|jgi:hypothetical protein|nr:hypothetical protein [Treponema sp.]
MTKKNARTGLRAIIQTYAAFSVAAVLVWSCAGQPEWVSGMADQDQFYYGVGSAAMANTSIEMQASADRARADLAAQLETDIKRMAADYSRSVQNSRRESFTGFYENMSEQLSAVVISGAEIDRRGRGGDGNYYTRVKYPKQRAEEALTRAIEDEALKNAEFDKDRALQAMNEALQAKR